MITSTSTAIQDFNFLESLGDNIDVQNAQTQNLLEKYGSIENFKQAFRNETQGQNFDSNLPITTMAEGAMSSAPNLRELPTGDAGIAESMSPQLSEGTRSGSNINQQVVPSDKNLPLSKDFIKEGLLSQAFEQPKTRSEARGLQADDMSALRTRKEADRETGLESLEDDILAYIQGRIPLSDLTMEQQQQVASDQFQDIIKQYQRDKERGKAMGLDVGILGLKTSQRPEMEKREEIMRKAELMNPGDPNAGRNALDEYLLKQKTKLDDSKKDDLEITVPVGDLKFTGETPQDPEPVRKKINPNNLVDGLTDKGVADDTKKTIVENAPSSLKKLAKGFGDALFDPDNKGGIAAIFIGANMMSEANFGDAVTKGLAQASDFISATGGKASDKQVVELADGRIVLVNKKTGKIEDTGEKGKGTTQTAAIKTLNAKAEILGIDVKDLLQFELTKGDDTYEERVQKIASKIISTSIVPLEPKDAVNQAKDLIEEIDKLSSSTIDNLLEQEG
jgi:hypothetical protein